MEIDMRVKESFFSFKNFNFVIQLQILKYVYVKIYEMLIIQIYPTLTDNL